MVSAIFLALLCSYYALAFADRQPISIVPLPDGVSITGGEKLHQIVATWQIYVTLEPPPFPQDLAQQVASLNQTFVTLFELRQQGIHIDLQPHRLRKQRLESRIYALPNHRRMKRGLLDIGGSILNALFGVATSAQLDRFNNALSEIGTRQASIVHAHNTLVTIVNQTRIYSEQLAIKQHEMEIHVMHLNTVITKIVRNMNQQAIKVSRIELTTDLDRYLDILDLAADAYASQVELFHRQRAELELSHLTRDLLSPTQLRDILQQAGSSYSTIPQVEWYYQYLPVTPLWQPVGSLLYKVEIPLVAPRPYLLYNILAHPVPVSNSSFTVKLNIDPYLAMDTVSGNLFRPDSCVGHGPSACRTGPEFGPSMLTCARGLLTNRQDLIKTCKVNVERYDGTTLIQTIDTNTYAVASQGETLIVRCPGFTEQHQTLAQGTFNLSCHAPCVISGKGWSVTCIDKLFLERTYKFDIVRVTNHFSFANKLSPETIDITLPELKLDNARPALGIPVGSLLYPDKSAYNIPSPETTHIFTWFNFALIMLVLCTIAATLLYNRRPIVRCIRRMKHKSPEQHFMSTLEPTAPEPTKATFWPLLPSMTACTQQSPPSPITDDS